MNSEEATLWRDVWFIVASIVVHCCYRIYYLLASCAGQIISKRAAAGRIYAIIFYKINKYYSSRRLVLISTDLHTWRRVGALFPFRQSPIKLTAENINYSTTHRLSRLTYQDPRVVQQAS